MQNSRGRLLGVRRCYWIAPGLPACGRLALQSVQSRSRWKYRPPPSTRLSIGVSKTTSAALAFRPRKWLILRRADFGRFRSKSGIYLTHPPPEAQKNCASTNSWSVQQGIERSARLDVVGAPSPGYGTGSAPPRRANSRRRRGLLG